ncbi:hypothetical protein C8Q77DRAFT_120842 [Trametes polyzona]|nr:hypothetical protein C8Q77DRAFT_120842 [Trametes polyzona]
MHKYSVPRPTRLSLSSQTRRPHVVNHRRPDDAPLTSPSKSLSPNDSFASTSEPESSTTALSPINTRSTLTRPGQEREAYRAHRVAQIATGSIKGGGDDGVPWQRACTVQCRSARRLTASCRTAGLVAFVWTMRTVSYSLCRDAIEPHFAPRLSTLAVVNMYFARAAVLVHWHSQFDAPRTVAAARTNTSCAGLISTAAPLLSGLASTAPTYQVRRVRRLLSLCCL